MCTICCLLSAAGVVERWKPNATRTRMLRLASGDDDALGSKGSVLIWGRIERANSMKIGGSKNSPCAKSNTKALFLRTKHSSKGSYNI
eukprot:3939139-Rhodomonas_salina.1